VFDGQAAPLELKGSPGMGEHTEAMLSEVGYGAGDIADLKSRKIVQ